MMDGYTVVSIWQTNKIKNVRFTNINKNKEVTINIEEYIIRAMKGEHAVILYLIEKDEEILYCIAFSW